MTFLEALKSNKPMRRKAQAYSTGHLGWRWLGTKQKTMQPPAIGAYAKPTWLSLTDGKPWPLDREDYLADDWEVMS